MSEQQAPIVREDTMIYREPTHDSTEIQDIWGRQLETKVVDEPEVAAFIAEGWVRSPLEIHEKPKPKPEQAAGFEPDHGALADAEKLASELIKENDALRGEVKALTDNLKAAEDLASEEAKAKEAALARVAELERPKLGIKKG